MTNNKTPNDQGLNKTTQNTNALPNFNLEELINKDDKKEKKKIKRNLLKLDDQLLLYSENGIRKFYDTVINTEFKEKISDVNYFL